ncbi:MAG: 4-phosphoerythronate dehydrogenase [Bacteroidetes bacterium]|nr:4-phosphoerythronate dehydrogenase [Bacteroidota bacterium]
MKIVVDQHIPYITEVFAGIGQLIVIPGQDITSESIGDADALIVRSITRIDRELLGNSQIKFVGSATAGLDHVDPDFLRTAGIQMEHAPGANAESVVEYVLACLAWFGKQSGQAFTSRSIGIVGVGNVGGLLAKRCEALGMTTFKSDPPLESQSGTSVFTPLPELLETADIVSVHTPLTINGPFPTKELIGPAELLKLKRDAWFIHSARGGVCNEAALISAKSEGRIRGLALDVWENEPNPSLNSVLGADLSTGHIAGYSIDAKKAGILKLRDDLMRFFNIVDQKTKASALRNGVQSESIIGFSEGESINDLIEKFYPIEEDHVRFRSAIIGAAKTSSTVQDAFHTYRATYPERRRFGSHRIEGPIPAAWRSGLGLE